MNTTSSERTPTLGASLLPDAIQLDMLLGKLAFKSACAVNALLINVAQQTIKSISEGKYLDLDALTGNYGCQVHTIRLYAALGSPALPDLFKALAPKLDNAKDTLNLIKNRQNSSKYCSSTPLSLFREIAGIAINEDIEYLLQSRLLTITKQVFLDKEGYETEKTELGLLDRIALGIPTGIKSDIVDLAQCRLSESSLVYLRAQTARISCISLGELDLLKVMLMEVNVCQYSASDGYRKKTFSCTYYNFKAVMLRLREQQVPIVVKRMAKKGEKFHPLMYRSNASGGPLELQKPPLEEQSEKTVVVVLEAFIPNQMAKEAITAYIQKHGLYEICLASAAQAAQYVPGKPNYFQVENEEARKEIRMQSEEMAPAYDCKIGKTATFDICHLSCDSLANSMPELFPKKGRLNG